MGKRADWHRLFETVRNSCSGNQNQRFRVVARMISDHQIPRKACPFTAPLGWRKGSCRLAGFDPEVADVDLVQLSIVDQAVQLFQQTAAKHDQVGIFQFFDG